jgi:uncharacterized coiled-coil protein SlyX
MSTDEVGRIRDQLRLVTEEFEREMRERGFDPQQVENIPLSPSLARLQLEVTNLRALLAALTEQEQS